MLRLCDRFPVVSAEDIIDEFVPPPRFREASLQNYLPDPHEHSQRIALNSVRAFVDVNPSPKRKLFARPAVVKAGIYLDGGYGVGKTHLLAGLWHASHQKATFASFVEYTNAVGALGFNRAVDLLSQCSLVCIDEFELDDPGDTVLMSTLLQRLVDNGVKIAATSNTLPDKLGEGRFAADNFLREIQGLKAHFNIIRIDGPDYRHRENIESAEPLSDEVLKEVAQQSSTHSLDSALDIEKHLIHVHPSAFGVLVNGISRVCISQLTQVTNQMIALRWVVLIDRLYDRAIPVSFSGCQVEELFSPEMLKGGYRKKYLRALSRLSALSREI